jgi:hypothetical protein
VLSSSLNCLAVCFAGYLATALGLGTAAACSLLGSLPGALPLLPTCVVDWILGATGGVLGTTVRSIGGAAACAADDPVALDLLAVWVVVPDCLVLFDAGRAVDRAFARLERLFMATIGIWLCAHDDPVAWIMIQWNWIMCLNPVRLIKLTRRIEVLSFCHPRLIRLQTQKCACTIRFAT